MARLWSQLAPRTSASEIVGATVDAICSRRDLVIENAVLPHQVNDLRRRSKLPRLQLIDRIEAARFRKRYRGELGPRGREYLAAVEALANRSARLRRAVVTGAIALLGILVAAAAVALLAMTKV